MAADTGNTYISETVKDVIKITTTFLGFTTIESSKVSASDCDSDRQREITMAAKTTGTVYIFGMTAAKFQQQI